ncbi:hypothetical protein SESBI_15286 [Sesbania bispinosa]|nr:hypothetical protein SESBI_15286 [Sesbania bispinosa]
MDAASTGGGEVTSREMRVQDRYAWVDVEVLGTVSRYCGETEATLRASFSVLDPDYEELYTVSPPEASDRGFVKSFEILCGFLAVVPTVPLFSHFFDVCPRKAGEKGWVSLRGHNGRPLLTLYVDSAKSSGVSFKRDFFKVVPKDRVLPFWRSSWEEQEPNFSIYWDSRHYDWGPRTGYQERGGTRYSSQEGHMKISDLLKKAKVVGLDDPKAKDNKKRKTAEGSSITLSNSQSLALPQSIADRVLVPDPQSDRALGPSDADGKKKKSKVVTKNLDAGPKADGSSSSECGLFVEATCLELCIFVHSCDQSRGIVPLHIFA